MKFEFNLTVNEIIYNYLIMMAVIIGAGFSGFWALGLLALPLFLRGLIGWCPVKTILKNSRMATKVNMPQNRQHRRVAA